MNNRKNLNAHQTKQASTVQILNAATFMEMPMIDWYKIEKAITVDQSYTRAEISAIMNKLGLGRYEKELIGLLP